MLFGARGRDQGGGLAKDQQQSSTRLSDPQGVGGYTYIYIYIVNAGSPLRDSRQTFDRIARIGGRLSLLDSH